MEELMKERDILKQENKGLLGSKEDQELHYMDQIISMLSVASLDYQEQEHTVAGSKEQATIPQLPSSCYCPITCELLTDPVIVDADCSCTVSREAMKQWSDQNKTTCPVCNSVLRSYVLKPNAQLRETIEFLVAQPSLSEKKPSPISQDKNSSVSSVSNILNASTKKKNSSNSRIISSIKNIGKRKPKDNQKGKTTNSNGTQKGNHLPVAIITPLDNNSTTGVSEARDTKSQSPTSKEERIEVHAPPGRLGVVIDTPECNNPFVWSIKDSSPIADLVRVGDKLIAVDDKDVTSLTAAKVSEIMTKKATNPTRKLSFIRTHK